MSRRVARWVIPPLMCLVSVAVTVLTVYGCHTVPFDQCSEVYQQYHDFPGIRAAFIKNKQINDTLRLDMTLLQAEDSLAFANLLKEWRNSDEYINSMMSHIVDENTRFVKITPKGSPDLPPAPDDKDNEITAIFPYKKAVAVFHTNKPEQVDLLLDLHFDKKVNI